MELGGGLRRSAPSGVGNSVVLSKTMLEESTVIFCSLRCLWAEMAASNDDGDDALVFRQQVVGKLVEVADAADHGGGRDEMVAVGEQLVHQRYIFCIAFDQLVAGMGIVDFCSRPYLLKLSRPTLRIRYPAAPGSDIHR